MQDNKHPLLVQIYKIHITENSLMISSRVFSKFKVNMQKWKQLLFPLQIPQ